MKTSKRLLSLLLAVVMVITTCSVGMSAFAADKNDDVFTYVTDEGKAVDITYESLNNLINTYAPEIIKLLGDKLTGLGVNVDEVCASDKPIYELLAQLSPALIKLMGSSSVTDEVIKDILLDAGIIGDDVAESDQLDAVKFAYVQYAYLNDAAAPMSIWNLYQFCMDNEKADDKDKKTDKKDAVAGEKEDKTVAGTEETENVGVDVKTETVNTDIAQPVEVSVSETVAYTHVDVRL